MDGIGWDWIGLDWIDWMDWIGLMDGDDTSFLYYLCAGTTATKPVTDMARDD